MPEDMYPSTEEVEVSEETETKEPESPETKENEDGETALVPKSALGGECKVGETYSMKVVGIYDDEVELAKVKESKSSDDDEESESKIEAMATEE